MMVDAGAFGSLANALVSANELISFCSNLLSHVRERIGDCFLGSWITAGQLNPVIFRGDCVMSLVRKIRFDRPSACAAAAVIGIVTVCATTFAQLPDIQLGDIAVRLRPVALGQAPLYGINPPGDTDRLYVLEQNGLVKVMINDVMQPTRLRN
jgi:hypothetical protein